jgi:hypothetical protein
MTEEIKWTVSVAIAGGPSIAQPGVTKVDAYDKVELKVKGGEKKSVDLVPSSATLAKIQFLLITSDYLGDKLLYQVNNKAPTVHLDSVQLLMGSTLAFLPDVPSSIQFDNSTNTSDANIQILAGRLAVS